MSKILKEKDVINMLNDSTLEALRLSQFDAVGYISTEIHQRFSKKLRDFAYQCARIYHLGQGEAGMSDEAKTLLKAIEEEKMCSFYWCFVNGWEEYFHDIAHRVWRANWKKMKVY